jgi:cell pole-organizing protein PopZ
VFGFKKKNQPEEAKDVNTILGSIKDIISGKDGGHEEEVLNLTAVYQTKPIETKVETKAEEKKDLVENLSQKNIVEKDATVALAKTPAPKSVIDEIDDILDSSVKSQVAKPEVKQDVKVETKPEPEKIIPPKIELETKPEIKLEESKPVETTPNINKTMENENPKDKTIAILAQLDNSLDSSKDSHLWESKPTHHVPKVEPIAQSVSPENEGSLDIFKSEEIAENVYHNLSEPSLSATKDSLSKLKGYMDLVGEATRKQSTTLDDLVREAVKPIIIKWLDDNLAQIVERQVEKEIKTKINLFLTFFKIEITT